MKQNIGRKVRCGKGLFISWSQNQNTYESRRNQRKRIEIVVLKSNKIRSNSRLTKLSISPGFSIYLTAKKMTPLTITLVSTITADHLRNFQNRSRTELWIPNRVLIVSALLAMTSRIGQMAIVKPATSTTGASDVIACAASGCFSIKSRSSFTKPAMLSSEASAVRIDTGKI